MIKTRGGRWTIEEVARFEARWPSGTRERLAFDLLLHTGLRGGDVVRLGPSQVQDGAFKIDAEKDGVGVAAPILPALAHSIAVGPAGEISFLADERGAPMTNKSFGEWFRHACKAAGVAGSPHDFYIPAAARAGMPTSSSSK
jgi:integrase